ncbi:hypothetical protein Mkiyose1665_17590 [Mycobacterium kiyosense]|uniref:Uncharacterized protein n=1 Tax=Mycobacterium kiyosense TaxID=2871094 RepID=A0A9P3UW58_9MYCO|nr:hypothetical protein IWGMT90018_14240 [Mycobacterium kiyosense]BDE12777.1 hypothetical protein MKCMC460_16370 [Mycobacterium sp. 20KCMC460]GLB82459.1 hypothetical protein SRL2020028_17150 [Mycobacterium kiyosense]GLB87779.1 hypothetical protein SRL2020130_05960 [Mycobacterium kiyosense]GLB93938.1 hypothetical protein SRL2020226_07140 [Mycobacterium kiyosense]
MSADAGDLGDDADLPVGPTGEVADAQRGALASSFGEFGHVEAEQLWLFWCNHACLPRRIGSPYGTALVSRIVQN